MERHARAAIWTNYAVSASYLGSYSDHSGGRGRSIRALSRTATCIFHGVDLPGVHDNAATSGQRRVSRISGENPRQPRRSARSICSPTSARRIPRPQADVQRRSAGGVSLNGNYTVVALLWRNTSGGFLQAAAGFTDPDNPEADRGYATRIGRTWRR